MQLKGMAGVGSTTIAKFGKNQPVSMEVMIKLCTALECDIGDVMEILSDEK